MVDFRNILLGVVAFITGGSAAVLLGINAEDNAPVAGGILVVTGACFIGICLICCGIINRDEKVLFDENAGADQNNN